MNPQAVVENLNIFKDALPCLSTGIIILMEDHLSFKGTERALYGCIVPAVSLAAHTA
jgi:hypothetical protein